MKKTFLIASGVIVLLAVLAGAAYVAGRLLNRPASSDASNLVTVGSGGGTMYQIVDLETKRAKELPGRPSDVTGLLTGVENNSIYVGIGPKQEHFAFSTTDGRQDDDADDYDASDFDAIVELVITRDTELYKDVTGIQVLQPGQELEVIQQKVAPLALDEVGGQGIIIAWGERRGDRLIADVVLCRTGC